MRQSDPAVIRGSAFGISGRYTIEPHTHQWSQLIYASSGVITVHTDRGSWAVPPERGVWVPAGVTHSIGISGQVSMRMLYFAPGFARKRLPKACAVVNISALMRELILHASAICPLNRGVKHHMRLAEVIVDQMRELPEAPLELAMPHDASALRAAAMLKANPGATETLDRVARQAGASKRTLERRFRQETGMGFGRWRQQLRLLHALRLLAEGGSVTEVAMESGYQSTSAFIAMFKRALGATPRTYRRRDGRVLN